jgi:hypothetical protein
MDYIKNPIFVATINPNIKKISKLYYFLGNVPNNILNILQKNEKEELLSKSELQILETFYGKKWIKKISGSNPDISLSSIFSNKYIIGGDEINYDNNLGIFGDLSYFDDNVKKIEEFEKKSNDYFHFTSGLKTVYSNISIYPEDNLYDIRRKIELISGIPIYRQFIFFYINDNGPYYAYKIYINKIEYQIDWKDILKKYVIDVNKIGIDSYFEQNKNEIEINSFDRNIHINYGNNLHINKIYLIDLNDVIGDMKVTDTYQLNLLYYGYIIKYWPQLSLPAFKLLLDNPSNIPIMYPNITFDFNKLYNYISEEQTIINKTFKYFDNINYLSIISNSIIYVYPGQFNVSINLRNVFDLLELTDTIDAMFINFTYGLVKKQYYISKKHISQLHKYYSMTFIKDSLVICIENEHQVFISLNNKGEYKIYVNWLEQDEITFDNIINITSKIINPVINKINELAHKVFIIGNSLLLLNNQYMFVKFTTIINYLHSFTLHEFINLKSEFSKLEKHNIIKIYGEQSVKTYTFNFYKGIHNDMVDNSYDWLYEENVNLSVGRLIRITHKSNKLQIKFIDIKSIREYDIIKRYVFSIISEYVKHLKPASKKHISNVKLIKKLHDLDPNLYDMAKYSEDAPNYSVLCQFERQPLIYDQTELKSLDNVTRNKLVKYWNFTNNKPAYYLCNKKYPYINFIVNKHPKQFCLPCCKKLKDNPNTQVAAINNKCLTDHYYYDSKTKTDYVLSYGKTILVGRKSKLPNELTSIFKKHLILGVKQYDSGDMNIGFIYSLKQIFGPNCIQELADMVYNMEQYYTLAYGKANIFLTAENLATEIIINFVDNNLLLNRFDISFWTHILTDLVRYKYKVEIITFVDINGEIHINAYNDATLSINNNFKIIALFKNDTNGINPIVREDNSFIFESSSIKYLFSLKSEHVINLMFMIQCLDHIKIPIKLLLINMKNMCYGLIVSKNIYIPITESYWLSNDIPISYNIRPKPAYSKSDLMKVINKINKYKSDTIIVDKLVSNGKYIIGFKSVMGLYYFHKPESGSSNNTIITKYDLRDVDKSILTRHIITDKSKNVLEKIFNVNMYKLFNIEFVTNIIRSNKNIPIRNKLKKIFSNIDISDSHSIRDTLFNLAKVLKDYQLDYLAFQNFIEFYYFNSLDIYNFNTFIDTSTFEFDYTYLDELRKLDKKNIIKEIKKMMSPYIDIKSKISNIPQYYNIFVSCSKDSNQFFCKNNKLIIDSNKLDDYLDVLANDVLNKPKKYILISSISDTIDYLNFIKRPYEYIDIEEIKNI